MRLALAKFTRLWGPRKKSLHLALGVSQGPTLGRLVLLLHANDLQVFNLSSKLFAADTVLTATNIHVSFHSLSSTTNLKLEKN